MYSAPMPASKSSSYFSRISRYSLSFKISFFCSGVEPGSVTMYAAKYSTCSSMRGEMSSISPMRDGMPLKYQMCDTGAASSMWPMRSRRTLARVTSTPQRSQILPLKRMRLYLPQWHSQSLLGPKMRSQNRPSRSGFRVR